MTIACEPARQNAPEIHRRYGTTAAYLDVHTCVPPWHQLDHEAGQPYAAMCRGKVIADTALFTTFVGLALAIPAQSVNRNREGGQFNGR